MDNLISMADKKIHTLGIRVDDETYNYLESLAKDDERTVSWIVRKLIKEWIEKKKLSEKELLPVEMKKKS